LCLGSIVTRREPTHERPVQTAPNSNSSCSLNNALAVSAFKGADVGPGGFTWSSAAPLPLGEAMLPKICAAVAAPTGGPVTNGFRLVEVDGWSDLRGRATSREDFVMMHSCHVEAASGLTAWCIKSIR